MLYGSSNATPAITVGADILETLAFQHIGEIDQFSSGSRRIGDASEELLEVLFVLFIPGWQLFDSERFTLPKEIGHKDLSAQSLGQDVGSLQSLGEVTRLAGWCPIGVPQSRNIPEDIVNYNQRSLALIACDVDAIECAIGFVGALGSVVYLDGRDRAAGLVGVMHSGHGSGKGVEMARDNPESTKHP